MRFGWLAPLIFPAIAVLGLFQMSSHPREQTAFLERIANRLEQVRTIPPETESAIRDTIRSIRRAGPPGDERLEARQRVAIERIENTLWSRTGTVGTRLPEAMAGGTARPRLSAGGDSESARQGTPLRPLHPFRSQDHLPGASPDCCGRGD
jgi:hypothetical protein